MRTTLNIDDDVLEAARRFAEARHISLGEALSSLARRGIVEIGLMPSSTGLMVFDVPDHFSSVGVADVASALAEFP